MKYELSKCEAVSCGNRAVMHVTRAKTGRVTKVISLCESHATAHFENEREWYEVTSRVGVGQPLTIGNGVAFQVDYLMRDERIYPPWGLDFVHLIEVGGRRHFGFPIGVGEASALNFELHHVSSPRPVTHRGMASVIAALGGRLDHVEIDKYFPENQTYEAKLHIKQVNSKEIVDVRPSDAFVLALVCDVPIIISEDVLMAIENQ